MGTNAHDITIHLRTATGASSETCDAGSEDREDLKDVEEGSVNCGKNSDGKVKKGDTMLFIGSMIVDERKLELWACTLPRSVNKEHSAEKGDSRDMFREGGRSWAMERALDVIVCA